MVNSVSLRLTTSSILTILIAGANLVGCNDSRAEQEPPGRAQSTVDAHATPGETYIVPDASKRDPGRLWCHEHGRYEDECFLCHPELLQSGSETENEAKLLIESDWSLSGAAMSDIAGLLYCDEHSVVEEECGICHPESLKTLPVGEGLKIRFSSPYSARKAGVRTGFPDETPVTIGVQALGELTYNKNKLAVVAPYASGVIDSILVDIGQSVEEGQLMAEVSSPAIADARSAFVQSLVYEELRRQTYDREKGLAEKKISSQQDYEDAHAAYATSTSEVGRTRQQLLNFGLSEQEVLAVEKDRSTSSILPLRAPLTGVIVERDAVLGTAVGTGTPLFRVADLSTMWLELSVPEGSAMRLRSGAPVRAEFDAFPGEIFDGEVTWIASHIDKSTRTVEIRASLSNPEHRLKSGLFGRALIIEAVETAAFNVPEAALQYIDGTSVVFAKLDEDLYETRVVKTGPTSNNRVAIIAGLTQFDEIVISESFILKSELLKGRLGAGCVDE